MKLYGNKRRRPPAQRTRSQESERQMREKEPLPQAEEPWRQPVESRRRAEKTKEQLQKPQTETEEKSGSLSARTKAKLLLAAAICIFICATSMCLALIAKSAEPLELPSEPEAKELSYVVNSVQPSTAAVPSDYEAPVSRNDSETLNILLIGRNKMTAQTDTLLLASVHLQTGELALLSIPRDTYIAGNYEIPKINLVYSEADDGKGRGVNALLEMVKGMVGFDVDYYFVLDEASLTAMTDSVGGVDFTVPDTPDYSELAAGKQHFDGKLAMQMLTYRTGYTDVEVEPARVQREFLLTLLEALLKDPDAYEENAKKIAAVSDTDLTAESLTYLAYLLQNVDTSAVFSRALPGGEIEIEDVTYYEVDPEAAIELLNEHFNPLKNDLTVYDVHFRQKTADSSSGEFDPYGFGNNSASSNHSENTENSTEASSEETDLPTEGSDPTDPTEPPVQPDPTDPPAETEPPAAPEEP